MAFWAQWDSSLREATGKRPVHAELLAKQVEVAHALVLNKASELRSEMHSPSIPRPFVDDQSTNDGFAASLAACSRPLACRTLPDP